MTEEDQARAFRLYEDVKKRMTTTVEDLIEAAQQSGTDITFNRVTGDVILNRNGESKLITELANLKMDEGSNYLYLNTYAGTNIELHEAVYVDEATGKIRLGTNLGKEFGEKNRIQKDVAIAIKNGNDNVIINENGKQLPAGFFFTPSFTIEIRKNRNVLFSSSKQLKRVGAKDKTIAKQRAYSVVANNASEILRKEFMAF